MMIKNKTSYCFLLVSIFFTSVMGIEAQQIDYYFNPIKNPEGITIQQDADFVNYNYEYEIYGVNENFNFPIRPRTLLSPSGVRERFISTLDELNDLEELRIINKDLEINWTGRNADGTAVKDGLYQILIYEIPKNNKRKFKLPYLYNVIIDTTEAPINVQRSSDTVTVAPPVTITVVTPVPENKTENYLTLRPGDYIIYNVKRGDYLAKIAREYYGSAPLWGLIYEINRNKLPLARNPNLILPRTQLILPTKKFMADFLTAGRRTSR